MARQDLGYLITVNDAQLVAATARVKAFNAEMARSTLTGRNLDTSFRAIGRRAVEVGKFFTRAFTIPIALVGAASIKLAGDFDTSMAKIKGLVGGTDEQLQRLRKTALDLSRREITQGPQALADAMFFLRSVGLSTNQTIKAIVPISRASVAGLGSVATITEAVTSVMDAYGFANISAAHATDVLVETVTKGKIPPEQLAASLGRVIPIANAMGVSFDQVGAAIASMTRQGLSANLAVTGLRAIFSTFQKGQPQTVRGLAAIGTSINAIQASLAKGGPGLFATLLGVSARAQAQFGKIKTADIFSPKTLEGIRKGTADFGAAMQEVQEKVQRGGSGTINVLAKVFPNIRALTAFLILVGPRLKANAGIFDDLAATIDHIGEATNRAFREQQKQPIKQLQLQLNRLKVSAINLGEAITPAVAGFAKGLAAVFHFLVDSGGTTKRVIKDVAIALAILGPGIQIFGRLTQGLSAGIFAIGKFQERASVAALKTKGIFIEQDKALVAANKAVFPLVDSVDALAVSADRAAAAFGGVGPAAQRSFAQARTAAVGAAGAPIVGAGSVRRGGGAAVAQGAAVATTATDELAVSQKRLGQITQQEQAKIVAAYARVRAAQQGLIAQQEAVNAAFARATTFGISPRQAGALAEQKRLLVAQRELAAASAGLTTPLIAADKKLIGLERDRLVLIDRLKVAETELGAAVARQGALLVSARAAGVEAASAEVAAIQAEIAQRGRDIVLTEEQITLETERAAAIRATAIAMGEQAAAAEAAALASRRSILLPTGQVPGAVTPLGPFGAIGSRAVGVQQQTALAARTAQGELVTAANITATKWGTAMEGMKSTAKGAFDFIAVIFLVDLVSKLIFGGDKARDHLKKDFHDIAHSATVEFAAAGLALAGLLGGLTKLQAARSGPSVVSRIGAATGGETAVGGALAGLGLGASLRELPVLARGLAENGKLAIGLRGKLALAAVGFIGLKTAGVDTTTILNAAFIGMAAKAVISTRIAGAAITGLAERGGFLALAGRIGLVARAFGSWPAAIIAATIAIGSQVPPIRHAIDKIKATIADLGPKQGAGQGGFKNAVKGIAGGSVKDVVGLFSFGQLAPFPTPFNVGSRDVHKLGDETKKTTKDMKALAHETGVTAKKLRELLPGFETLNKRQQVALRLLVNRGDVDAARQVLQKFLNVKLDREVKDAAAFLGKHGFGDVKKFLETSTKAARDASQAISDAFGSRLTDQILGAFDASTERLLDAFDRQTDKILSAFDAQTAKMEDKLKFTVKVPKLHENFTVTVNGKTPAERELEALDRVEARRRASRDLFDANKALSTAFQIGDPTGIRDAARARQDAQTETRRNTLTDRAKVERAAADQAIKIGKERFEAERAALRDNLERRRETMRRDLDSTRKLQHDQIEAAIKAQIDLVNKGKESIGTFYKHVLGIMRRNNITVAQAGRDGGKGFALGLESALNTLRKKVDADLDHIKNKAKGTAASIAKAANNLQRIVNLDNKLGGPLDQQFNPATKLFGLGPRQTQEIDKFVHVHPSAKALAAALKAVGIGGVGVPTPLNSGALHEVGEKILKRVGIRGMEDLIFYLKHHKLARHAAGGVAGVVGGFGEGDIVPALLKPGELILNQGHQVALKRRLGLGGNPRGLFNHIQTMAKRGPQFASGGLVRATRRPEDDPGLFPPDHTVTSPKLGSQGPSAPHNGVRWGGQIFYHADDLYRWVKGHGSRFSQAQFFALHPGAAQILGYRGVISQEERAELDLRLANRRQATARGRNDLLHEAERTVLRMATVGAARFAKGGLATPTAKQLFPGFAPSLTRALTKLIRALQRSALQQARLPQDPRTAELILGGSFKGKGKKRHFVKDTSERLRHLRQQLDPVWATGLVHRLFPNMDRDRRKELEGRAAQIQAHPVLAGLITPTATGTRRGGRAHLPQRVTNVLGAARGSALSITGFSPGGGIQGRNNIANEPLRRVLRADNHAALRALLLGMIGNRNVKIGASDRVSLRSALTNVDPDGLFEYVRKISRGKFAAGGAVPGLGGGDIVPAMLTPGELVLGRGHQEGLMRALGIGGNAAGLFSHIESLARSGGRFASGGTALPQSAELTVPVSSGGGGGGTVVQQVHVDIHDSRNPDQTARSVRRELLKHAQRNASAPRGRVRNRNIGLG